MTDWPKRTVDWTEGQTAFVSVPFTWELQPAYQRCVFLRAQGYNVRAGGPAVSLMPDFLADVAELGGEVHALPHHNPDATFTSRGCIRKCPFCAVPKIEGPLRELETWERKPIVCDNNLLACSRTHFNKVIDSLKGLHDVDFNQGLDTRLLTKYHAGRLAELDCIRLRLAWDNVRYEQNVLNALAILRDAGFAKSKIMVYVLVGFTDTPDDAHYRMMTLWKLGVNPYVMRYHPLDALRKFGFVGEHWTSAQLKKFKRYWGHLALRGRLPFDQYRR